jgi:hypothetical protein
MRTYELSPLWLTIDLDGLFDQFEIPRHAVSDRGVCNE